MTDTEQTTPRPASGNALSLTALQCDLRTLLANRPTNRALLGVLQHIGDRLGAVYAVVHARLGVHLLSEEWQPPRNEIDSDARDFVNSRLWEAISAEEALCTRVPGGGVLIAAIMYDGDIEPSGGAGIVVEDCDKQEAMLILAQLEGVLGFLSLLLGERITDSTQLAERRAIEPHAAASHPTRLAYAVISEVEARYGCDLTAIGFVNGNRVEVAAVSGVEELRQANPGVAVLRAAMEECRDRGAPIVCAPNARGAGGGGEGDEVNDDCRLHAQWSAANNGNAVASLPLISMNEVVAVVSMAQGAGTQLTAAQIELIAEELSGYADLVPLTRSAARGLVAHTRDAVRDGLRRLFAPGGRRLLAMLLMFAGLSTWLAMGTLHHTFTVPCVVKAKERRTIACPRNGVLTELFAQPGDRVRAGQLLAALDANEEFLRRAELTAEIESLDALIDAAVADRAAGQLRVHEAKRQSVAAELAVVDERIGQSQIRAPQDGLILEGDLRESLGGRIKMGEPLFELARYDQASIELRIPERLVLAALDQVAVEFAPTARPSDALAVSELRIAPASTVLEGTNVFLGEGTVPIDLGALPPGMEGTALIDAGPRSAWWVLTHRVTDWLRLNFWL